MGNTPCGGARLKNVLYMGYYHKLSPMLSLTDFVISIPFLRAIFTWTHAHLDIVNKFSDQVFTDKVQAYERMRLYHEIGVYDGCSCGYDGDGVLYTGNDQNRIRSGYK